MINILVTGGAGFIGSNLCEHLLQKGYGVTCLDNFSTGHLENIQHLIDNYSDQFKLIKGDIRDFDICDKATIGVEYVFHEAALGSIPRSINDPRTTNDVNISGFLNMLVASRNNRVKRFIFASSSSIYGDNNELPKQEDHIGKPLSPYALTKYVGELYADIFAKIYGIEYIGLRYFNVFGRRQDPNIGYAAVIPLFIKEFMNHVSPTINGNGSYSRDFTYIDNVLHMNILAMETKDPSAVNQIYNTAAGERITINQLSLNIKMILSDFDPVVQNIQPKYGIQRKGDIPHSMGSIEKAKNKLGYSVKYSFLDGLKETISWYRSNLNCYLYTDFIKHNIL